MHYLRVKLVFDSNKYHIPLLQLKILEVTLKTFAEKAVLINQNWTNIVVIDRTFRDIIAHMLFIVSLFQ